MDKLFPVFINLRNKKVLIVGLGTVALRKAEALHRAGAHITAVGLELKSPKLQQFADVEVRSYTPGDIQDVFIAVAATSDKAFNAALCRDWDQRLIISNNATERIAQNCYFVHHEIIQACHVAVSGLGFPSKAKDFLNRIRKQQ